MTPDGDAPSPQALLDFWLGDAATHPASADARMAFWFEASPETDAAVRARFAEAAERAHRGALEAWRATPRGRLALVIALDQLPRNLHRGTPAAFASDAQALAAAREAICAGDLERLTPLEAGFLLLPFEHAEDLAAQDEGVARSEALAADAPPAWRPLLEAFADDSRQHRDLIARFGRFPHRNAILGRRSTPEEEAYLASGARAFGKRPALALRPYEDADLDAVVAMWTASKRDAFPYNATMMSHTAEEDRAFFRDVIVKQSEIFLAVEGDAVLGLLALETDTVAQLFVGVGRQRERIGTRLLDLAKQRSPAGLRLFTFQRNERGRRFYEKHGFVATQLGVSDPPESEPDVLYVWRPGSGRR